MPKPKSAMDLAQTLSEAADGLPLETFDLAVSLARRVYATDDQLVVTVTPPQDGTTKDNVLLAIAKTLRSFAIEFSSPERALLVSLYYLAVVFGASDDRAEIEDERFH